MNFKLTLNRIPALAGMAVGLLAVLLAIIVMCAGGGSEADLPTDTGTRTSYSYYGGDAYSGIQQAGADTARNVKLQSAIILSGFQSLPQMMPNNGFGFGAILLCLGLAMIAFFAHKYFEIDAREAFEARLLKAVGGEAPAEAADLTMTFHNHFSKKHVADAPADAAPAVEEAVAEAPVSDEERL